MIRIVFGHRGIVPVNTTGIQGCTGNSESSNCLACDRLRLSGLQIRPETVRDDKGGWTCSRLVIGGKHVGELNPETGV